MGETKSNVFRCYIGRRYLEAAIKSFDKDASITVIWKPFLLNPDMPDEGIPLLKYMADKFGEDAAKRISRGKGPIVEPGKKVVGKVLQRRSFFSKYLFVLLICLIWLHFPSFGITKKSF